MAANKKSWITAEELMQQMESDPEFLARRAEKAARHQRRAEELRQAQTPFLAALSEAGFPVATVEEIRQRYKPLPKQLSQLIIDWIPRIEHPAAQQWVAWALLAAPKRSLDGRSLTPLFDATKNDELKWAIADVIEQTRPQHLEGWMITAIKNWRSGNSRNLLASAIAKMLPTDQAVSVLIEVFDDIPMGAAHPLGKVGGEKVREFLTAKLPSATGPLRREIRQAIASIDRRLAKVKLRQRGGKP